MADISKLADELANDPLARGYAGMTDQQAADDLNSLYRERDKQSLTGDELFQQTDPSEYASLTDTKKSHWLAFTGKDVVDPFATNNVEFVKSLFPQGTTTLTNLANARKESISRAQELNLLGRSEEIGPAHVAEARA